MPENGRWDLIRRLKVNETGINSFYTETFVNIAPDIRTFFQGHEENNDMLLYLYLRVKRSRLTLTLKLGRVLTGSKRVNHKKQVRKCVSPREAVSLQQLWVKPPRPIYTYILSTQLHSHVQ